MKPKRIISDACRGLVDIIMSTVADVDKIDARQGTELEHNHALEQGILFQEPWIGSSTRRTNAEMTRCRYLIFIAKG
jgi:hypothetical protein